MLQEEAPSPPAKQLRGIVLLSILWLITSERSAIESENKRSDT